MRNFNFPVISSSFWMPYKPSFIFNNTDLGLVSLALKTSLSTGFFALWRYCYSCKFSSTFEASSLGLRKKSKRMQKDWSHNSNWLSATCNHTVPLSGIHIYLLWKSSSRQVRLMTYTPGQILGTCNLKSRVLLYILQCLLWLVHHWSETTNIDFVYHIVLLNVLSKLPTVRYMRVEPAIVSWQISSTLQTKAACYFYYLKVSIGQ